MAILKATLSGLALLQKKKILPVSPALLESSPFFFLSPFSLYFIPSSLLSILLLFCVSILA
jgi:hypothetical protein